MGAPRPAAPEPAEGFQSDSSNFSRATELNYAYADIAFSVPWILGLVVHGPGLTLFIPALITGVAAVLVDYVWFYRNGRREVLLDGERAGGGLIAWWLVFWFEFLIAFNMGAYLGLVLHVGLSSTLGIQATVAYLLFFWILTPIGGRLLGDLGIGRSLVVTTRRVGGGLSWGRLGATFALHAAVYFAVLSPDLGKSAELFAIGMLTAGGMELPLYMLRIRPGDDAWKAFVLNTLVEWNYAAPLMYLLLHTMGLAF
ncbi:MAG: hypothetical protein OXT09_06605 [Myxococcales bacterium]|nr:hypothetical protein [Myxococcales bacterium]